MATSPTQRTMAYYRAQGLQLGVVERFIQRPGQAFGFRKDLFGFVDIIACDPVRGIVGIQSCGQSFAEHKRKIINECGKEVKVWLECGGKLEIIGWRRVKKVRGGKAMVWKPRILEITLDMLAQSPVTNNEST